MGTLHHLIERTRVVIGEASTVLRDGQQLQVLVRRGKWPPDMYRKGTTATVVKGGKVGEEVKIKMGGDVMSGGQTFDLESDKKGSFRLVSQNIVGRSLKVKVVEKSESVEEGNEAKLAKAVFRKFPPDSKMKRGGKMKVMLTGNTAKVLGKKEHASVYLDDLSYDDLKKLAALWKIKTEDLDEGKPGWGSFKPEPRKPREKIDAQAEVKMALPIVTKYVDAIRALTDFGEYNKQTDRIRRIVKHMQGSHGRNDINLLHQAVSDLDLEIWKRHKKSISAKIPRQHMKSIEYHLGRAWNPGNPKESTDARAAVSRLSEAVVKKAAVPMDYEGFIAAIKKQARIKDRQLRISAGSFSSDKDMVFVNFINLPQGVGGAGGGAEAENNRWMAVVEGFAKDGGPPPKGKVKLKASISYGFPKLRGKTGKPEAIAKVIADQLTKIVKEVEPKFTRTKREGLEESMQLKRWYTQHFGSFGDSDLYFYAVAELKGGSIVGMHFEVLDGRIRGKAVKGTVGKMDVRQWKPIDEKDVPPKVKQKVQARIGDFSFEPKPVVSKPQPTLKPTGPLTDKERNALKVILGYKAFARAGEMQRKAPGVEYAHGDPTIRGLEARGLLKINKQGSIQAIRAKAQKAMESVDLDEAAKPVGKPQTVILAYVKKHSSKAHPIELNDLSRMPELRGVHFGKIQKAVEVLIKKGLLKSATGEGGKETAVKESDTMKGEACSKLHKLAGKSKKKKKSEEVDFTITNVSLDRIRVEVEDKVGTLDEKKSKKSMKPGGGGRFAKLKAKLAKKGDVEDPGAVAAAIGRKKFGKKKFAAMAAKGRARAGGG